MKGFHGLLQRLVSCAVIISLLCPAYPVFADEPKVATPPAKTEPAQKQEPEKEPAPTPPVGHQDPIGPADPQAAIPDPATNPPETEAKKEEATPAQDPAAPVTKAETLPGGLPGPRKVEPGKYDKIDQAAIDAKSPDLANNGKETNFSMLTRIAGDSWTDSKRFYPLMVMTILPTAVVYRMRWNSIRSKALKEFNLLKQSKNNAEWVKDHDDLLKLLQKKKMPKDLAEKFEALLAKSSDGGADWADVTTHITDALKKVEGTKGLATEAKDLLKKIEGLVELRNQIEWSRMQGSIVKADQKVYELFINAKSEEAKLFFDHAPESVKSKVIAKLKEQGLTEFPTVAPSGVRVTTLQELVDAFNDYHALNQREYELLKDLGKSLEIRLGLKPGQITAKLADPDLFLSDVTGVTTKVADRSKMLAESARYVEEVAAETTSRGATWRAFSYGNKSTHGLPWFTRPFGAPSVAKQFRNRVIRTSLPAVLLGTLIFGGYSTIRFIAEEPLRLQEQGKKVDTALKADEAQAIFNNIILNEQALALVVEVEWADMKTKYGGIFKTLKCPVSVKDPASVELVKQSHLFAQMDYLSQRKDPTEKGPEDVEAAKKVEELATRLGVAIPDPEKELSVRYYRLFWLTLWEKLKSKPTLAALNNLPAVRDRDVETLNPENRQPTLEEMIDNLAVESPRAMLFASRYHSAYLEWLEALSKYDKKKRTKFLADIKALEEGKYADLVKYLEEGIATLDKTPGLVDTTENPLKLDDKQEAEIKAAKEKLRAEATQNPPEPQAPVEPPATPAPEVK